MSKFNNVEYLSKKKIVDIKLTLKLENILTVPTGWVVMDQKSTVLTGWVIMTQTKITTNLSKKRQALHYTKGPFRDPQPHSPCHFSPKKLRFLMFVCKIFLANSFVWQNNRLNCLFTVCRHNNHHSPT